MRDHAFVTCVIRNDSYAPGALVLAHSLLEQRARADLVCLVTADVSLPARGYLSLLYDRVIEVRPVSLAHADQRRQYIGQVLTRVNALRLGPDGDLGCAYRKIVALDADLLALRHYDHLFLVDAPAGILNERPEHLKRTGPDRRYDADRASVRHGCWQWHRVYERMPHGAPVPASVTDRVRSDPGNLGVNTAVLVLEPSMREFCAMAAELERPGALLAPELLARLRWPDMQFLTLWWSGRWRNVDACFAGLCGYPDVDALFGTHFAGPKPWQVTHPTVARRFSRFPDFLLWYDEFAEMLDRYPKLAGWPRLRRISEFISDQVTVFA